MSAGNTGVRRIRTALAWSVAHTVGPRSASGVRQFLRFPVVRLARVEPAGRGRRVFFRLALIAGNA